MRNLSRTWAVAFVAVAALISPVRHSHAQSQRGQPATQFSLADFGKLRWLEGTWQGTSPNATTLYERCQFVNDSTIEIAFHADSPSGRETGTGRVYFSGGRIYYTLGSDRWSATRVDESGVYFIPQANAHNTYAWALTSPGAWTSTMRTGIGGHDRVVVYDMKRAPQ